MGGVNPSSCSGLKQAVGLVVFTQITEQFPSYFTQTHTLGNKKSSPPTQKRRERKEPINKSTRRPHHLPFLSAAFLGAQQPLKGRSAQSFVPIAGALSLSLSHKEGEVIHFFYELPSERRPRPWNSWSSALARDPPPPSILPRRRFLLSTLFLFPSSSSIPFVNALTPRPELRSRHLDLPEGLRHGFFRQRRVVKRRVLRRILVVQSVQESPVRRLPFRTTSCVRWLAGCNRYDVDGDVMSSSAGLLLRWEEEGAWVPEAAAAAAK